jgi:3-phosphoglycerate kinase
MTRKTTKLSKSVHSVVLGGGVVPTSAFAEQMSLGKKISEREILILANEIQKNSRALNRIYKRLTYQT